MKGSDWVSDTKWTVVQKMGNVVIQTTQQLIPIVSINWNDRIRNIKFILKAWRDQKICEDDTDKEELDAGDKFGGKVAKKKTRVRYSTWISGH